MSWKEKLKNKIQLRMLEDSKLSAVDGINICNIRHKDAGFEETITQSLELIKAICPKRYRYVKNEIMWIVNSVEIPENTGNYIRRLNLCNIHFTRFDEDLLWVSLFFAGQIVHEATHGVIYTKGFKYDLENRLQIERICVAEQNRFSKKAEAMYPEYQDRLVADFDPSGWDYSYNTTNTKKFYHTFKRILLDQKS
jgi:hypothetical protein